MSISQNLVTIWNFVCKKKASVQCQVISSRITQCAGVSQITLKNVNNSHILHKNDFELLQLRKKINRCQFKETISLVARSSAEESGSEGSLADSDKQRSVGTVHF